MVKVMGVKITWLSSGRSFSPKGANKTYYPLKSTKPRHPPMVHANHMTATSPTAHKKEDLEYKHDERGS